MKQEPDKSAGSQGIGSSWLTDPLLWPFAAAKSAVDACAWWLDHGFGSVNHHEPALSWTTPNKVALELSTLRLRDFSVRQAGQPALICAAFALHDALIADLAPGHSIVEALRRGGIDRLYLTDWRSASPDMRLLSIDNYLADLNVAIDEIGPPVDLIGLCQGGWLSLVYAARFPDKVRRLVLVGSPVDVSVESDLSRIVAAAPQSAFEALVRSGGSLVRGDHMLRFWSPLPDINTVLQRKLLRGAADDTELLDRFACWYGKTLDLPGTLYLEVVNAIFRENRLAKGTFAALGRESELARVTIPVFLLTGADDEVVPPAQALATGPLLGTSAALLETAIVPSTHLGLFVGSRTLAVAWPQIAAWLQSGEPRLREIASA